MLTILRYRCGYVGRCIGKCSKGVVYGTINIGKRARTSQCQKACFSDRTKCSDGNANSNAQTSRHAIVESRHGRNRNFNTSLYNGYMTHAINKRTRSLYEGICDWFRAMVYDRKSYKQKEETSLHSSLSKFGSKLSSVTHEVKVDSFDCDWQSDNYLIYYLKRKAKNQKDAEQSVKLFRNHLAKGDDPLLLNHCNQCALHFSFKQCLAQESELMISMIKQDETRWQHMFGIVYGRKFRNILHLAAMNGFGKMFRDIISMLPDDSLHIVNARDIEGKTPLHYAASPHYGNGDCLIKVKTMLQKPCDIDSLDKVGKTPLYYAKTRGQNDVVKFLLEQGASVERCEIRFKEFDVRKFFTKCIQDANEYSAMQLDLVTNCVQDIVQIMNKDDLYNWDIKLAVGGSHEEKTHTAMITDFDFRLHLHNFEVERLELLNIDEKDGHKIGCHLHVNNPSNTTAKFVKKTGDVHANKLRSAFAESLKNAIVNHNAQRPVGIRISERITFNGPAFTLILYMIGHGELTVDLVPGIRIPNFHIPLDNSLKLFRGIEAPKFVVFPKTGAPIISYSLYESALMQQINTNIKNAYIFSKVIRDIVESAHLYQFDWNKIMKAYMAPGGYFMKTNGYVISSYMLKQALFDVLDHDYNMNGNDRLFLNECELNMEESLDWCRRIWEYLPSSANGIKHNGLKILGT